ncbi:MAG: amidohydrolase family protein [Thermoplasmatota archaeon]
MTIFAGFAWGLEPGRFVEAWLDFEDGLLRATGRGPPPLTPVAHGVILPAPVNAHTHLGDACFRGRPEVVAARTLAALVGPRGVKHRLLESATPEETVAGMRSALTEMAPVQRFIDFREGGALGAQTLRAVAPHALILGRPAREDGSDLTAALAACDGFGLAALADVPRALAKRMSDATHRAKKRFAAHWSEGVREDLDALLDLAPDFIVHGVHAMRADFERLAAAHVPLVCCPRSNARLVGRLPDLAAALEAGVTVALGTDNAMLQRADVFEEARFLAARDPQVTRADMIDMLALGGFRVWSPQHKPAYAEGRALAEFVMLRGAFADPYSAVLGPEHARASALVA